MKNLYTIAAGALLLTACGDLSPVAAPSYEQRASLAAAEATANGLTVMTYNVYYGADFAPLLATPAEQVPFVAAGVWAAAVASDFPGRAGRIAAEIAAAKPHLVALQEAALYRVQHPGDAAFGGMTPATTVAYDFIALIQDSLAARGLVYNLAAADSTTDIELPVFMGVDEWGYPSFDDVRLTDRDAVLARADVQVDNAQHGVYGAYIPIDFGALQTGVKEGWSSVEVPVAGQTYRFVSTHLEFQEAQPVQVAQAQELLALLADESRPTILAGDFNSDAYGLLPEKATPSRGLILNAGFLDMWREPDRQAPGLSCCQANDLLNTVSDFEERVDFIFTRNLPVQTAGGVPALARRVVGTDFEDRTASGRWPSDHGGVVATLRTR